MTHEPDHTIAEFYSLAMYRGHRGGIARRIRYAKSVAAARRRRWRLMDRDEWGRPRAESYMDTLMVTPRA